MTRLGFFVLSAVSVMAPCLGLDAAIQREGWSFDRSQFDWYGWAKPDEQKQAGTLNHLGGWAEYDITVPADGWYELWQTGMPAEWAHDVYIDGAPVLWLATSEPADADPARKGWHKEANFFLTQGAHALRFRRLIYPGALPSAWELRPAANDPAGWVRVTDAGLNAVRVGQTVRLTILGGGPAPANYELVARDENGGELVELGRVDFPAAAVPAEKTVEFAFPREGIFQVLARVEGRLLRPADLKAGTFAVVDTQHAPPPAPELKTTSVVDIDCTAPPPPAAFWEKDGKTRVVDAPLGRYRESSGQGSVPNWGTDGFSYRFDLPEPGRLYRLRVDYPDDDRRSMGFWVNDSPKAQNVDLGTVNTGGVETGDHYPLTRRMLTHEAFFYPRNTQDLVIAVVSLVPGLKAAAARIRVDLVESPLPAAPLGETRDRAMGFYFEESGRWLRFFGGENQSPAESFKTLERWAQWNRYLGANLMYPTVNVYQSNRYPSRILDGYFCRPMNEARLAALVAEKYGGKFIPEIYLNGQKLFDWWVMGVEVAEKGEGKNKTTETRISKEAEDYVLRDRGGGIRYSSEPFVYNALHPRVQQMYIDVFGELADMLGDCESFIGISSRLMLSWQFQGWNALPGINWGYDDWTVAAFEKETGVRVPGAPGDSGRFRKRFEFLTGPERERWLEWRCARLFDFHRRLLERIRQAKPSAKLFFTFHRPYQRDVSSDDILVQLRDIGMDWKLYAEEPGMVIFPVALYGRRYSTPLNDADVTEAFFDERVKKVGRLGDRGFGLGSIYYEVNKHMDWAAFGGGPNAAFDTCTPSGVNEREFYALALADSDSSYLENGGSGWFFGTPEMMQPFLREFRALPAAAFERLEGADDPVAVWQRREKDGSLWFYAVNRLPVPVTARLGLAGKKPVVRPAPGGEPLPLEQGELEIGLEPFMMRSYRATGGKLRHGRVETPPEFVASLEAQVEAAGQLKDAIAARRIAPEATRQDAEEAVRCLDEARQAYQEGRYWRARAELERLAVIRMAYASGRYVPGVWQRSQPHGVPSFSDDLPAGFAVAAGAPPETAGPPADLAYDENGNLWMASDHAAVRIGSDGTTRRIALFEPYEFDEGNILHPTLAPARRFAPGRLRTAAGGRFVAQQGDGPPVLFDGKSGRAERLSLGVAFPVPAQPCTLLAADRGGDVLVSCSAPNHAGVYLYRPDGTLRRKISESPARAGAADAAGRLYLAGPDGITVADAQDAKPLLRIDEPAAEALAVTPDGDELLAVTDKGSAIVGYRSRAGGKFERQWKQPMPGAVTAISLSPQGTLAVGFRIPDNGASVREYTITSSGLKPRKDLVTPPAGPAAIVLDGFTQLKTWNRALYFAADGKLMRLRPGAAGEPDQIELAYDPQLAAARPAFEAFAFAPNGDLYLASHGNGAKRGVNLYRCRKSGEGWAAPEYLNHGQPVAEGAYRKATDLEVAADGRLIVMLDPAPSGHSALYAWSPDGEADLLVDMGKSHAPAKEYGLFRRPGGGWLVAGGDTRSIWSLASDGKVLWQTRRETTCPPGYADLRYPLGITATSKGDIWATDPVRHQILRLDANGKLLEAHGGFGGNGEAGRLAFNGPTGIAAIQDPTGTEWLYVADIGNRRLVKMRVPAASEEE